MTEPKKVKVTYVGERKQMILYGIVFENGKAVMIDPDMFCDQTRKIKALPKFIGNPDFKVDHPDNYGGYTHAVRPNKIIHIGGKKTKVVKENVNVFGGTEDECKNWIAAHGNLEKETHRVIKV